MPKEPRQPKCSRCRHHGIIVPQKGHSKVCPYIKCVCWKCHLITERTRIATLQRNMRRKTKPKEQHPVVEKPGMTPLPAGGLTPSVSTSGGIPLDLRHTPAPRGELEAGSERRYGPPSSSGEGGSSIPPTSGPMFDESNQSAPLPVIGVPYQMPGYHPNNFTLHPNLMLNMMWFPAVDPCNNRLPGHMMFPYFQPGAMFYPPPYEPGSPFDYRELTPQPSLVPEASQEGKKP